MKVTAGLSIPLEVTPGGRTDLWSRTPGRQMPGRRTPSSEADPGTEPHPRLVGFERGEAEPAVSLCRPG